MVVFHSTLAHSIFLEAECVAQTQDFRVQKFLMPDCGLGHLSDAGFAVPIGGQHKTGAGSGSTEYEGCLESDCMFALAGSIPASVARHAGRIYRVRS